MTLRLDAPSLSRQRYFVDDLQDDVSRLKLRVYFLLST